MKIKIKKKSMVGKEYNACSVVLAGVRDAEEQAEGKPVKSAPALRFS